MTARAEYDVSSQAATPPRTFDELYQQSWFPLLRLAVGLVDDRGIAEDVVQDAFAALYRRWDSIREPDAAIGYLRTSVVNNSRSVLRRRRTARKHLRVVVEETDEAADVSSLLVAEHEMVSAALALLPDRQREVLTLRYLTDLPDQAIAEATGLSLAGVRSASSRGLAALRTSLGGRL
jgi:RNA polymerase sigma-70 factor (sigma-E family)